MGDRDEHKSSKSMRFLGSCVGHQQLRNRESVECGCSVGGAPGPERDTESKSMTLADWYRTITTGFSRRLPRVICVAFSMAFLGCKSETRSVSSSPEYVKAVEYSSVPEMHKYALQTLRLANEAYPRIFSLFNNDTAGRKIHFSIVFREALLSNNVALTSGNKIQLSASWIRKHPENLEPYLTHEIAHMVQQYPHRSFWEEGLAEFARYKLGYTNSTSGPKCSWEYPHFRSGYWCTGAFLVWIDQLYGSSVIKQLHQRLKAGKSTEEVFESRTGKTVDALWTEFKSTDFYTAEADTMNRLQAASAATGNNETELLTALGSNVITASAIEFMKDLAAAKGLPGIKAGTHGRYHLAIDPLSVARSSQPEFPFRLRFFGRIEDQQTRYEILLLKSTEGAVWKIEYVWERTPDGRVIEMYSR